MCKFLLRFDLVRAVVAKPGIVETKDVESAKSLCVSPEVVETAARSESTNHQRMLANLPRGGICQEAVRRIVIETRYYVGTVERSRQMQNGK